MPTYVIATMTIHDPQTYRKYTELSPSTVSRHGGRFLTRGDQVTTLEGEPFTERMVILEFPSEEAVEAWLTDPEYIAAAEFRRAASVSRMLSQTGRDNTENPDPRV
jgi:uncharacterized protein (DUF1330 family)